MFSVFVLCPKNSVCGGDPKTEDGPAEKYSLHETGIVVYASDFPSHKIKLKCRDFFKTTCEKSVDFWAQKRWTFKTKDEALKKCLYEATQCGHFIPSRYGWIQKS